MNNTDVDRILQDCDVELTQIGSTISSSSTFTSINRHLTMYALVKSCSTIERSYKRIIADYYKSRCPDVAMYLENKVMGSSNNPTYGAICTLIKEFNDQTEATFKQNMQALPDYNRIVAQLHSLVTNRNNFAHGLTVTCSFTDIVDYYTCAKEVLVCMDNVIR